MEKKPMKLGEFTIYQWYRAAFLLIGFLVVALIVIEGTFFFLEGFFKAGGFH